MTGDRKVDKRSFRFFFAKKGQSGGDQFQAIEGTGTRASQLASRVFEYSVARTVASSQLLQLVKLGSDGCCHVATSLSWLSQLVNQTNESSCFVLCGYTVIHTVHVHRINNFRALDELSFRVSIVPLFVQIIVCTASSTYQISIREGLLESFKRRSEAIQQYCTTSTLECQQEGLNDYSVSCLYYIFHTVAPTHPHVYSNCTESHSWITSCSPYVYTVQYHTWDGTEDSMCSVQVDCTTSARRY